MSAETVKLTDVSFTKSDGSTALVSGRVEFLENGDHEVMISNGSIIELKLSMIDFEKASHAMSVAAMKEL